MAFTPDLPPGARPRMWIMTALTLFGGLVIYAAFGHLETLYIAGAVLFILLYLLAGVEMTLYRDRQLLAPLVDATLKALEDSNQHARFILLLDRNGIVLHLSRYGERIINHQKDFLVGQRFADLFPEGDTQERRTLVELLRFASLGHPWSGMLLFLDEDGKMLNLQVEALPIAYVEAKKMGFVALAASEN